MTAENTPEKGATETAPGSSPVKMPSTALTIPAKRLAGSPACLNCGTPLKGPFCYYCGQPDKNFLRFFPALLRDLLEDFLDFDSRFVRTMKPLILHPGRLTRDFLDGRRFRYTPPLRLYIFSSMAFFIIAAMLAGASLKISTGQGEDGESTEISFGTSDAEVVEQELADAVADGLLTDEQVARISQAVESASATAGDVGDITNADEWENALKDSGAPSEEDTAEPTFQFNDKPWDRETNPLLIPLVPDFVNDWINDEIEDSPRKGREIEENPNLIIDKIFDVLPIAVFIMLPLVALLFKFWYLFSGRYYVEHLIHALHNHAFLFVLFTLIVGVNSVVSWLAPDGSGRIANVAEIVLITLWCWIPIYLFVSLKTVYRQGWIMTLAKFSVIGLSYMSLLVLLTTTTALLGFLLL